MKINANEIKKVFKNRFGIKVRVRTVAVKHPFAQIWVEYGSGQVIPNEARIAAIKAVYQTEDFKSLNLLNVDNINYGNIRDNGLSFTGEEFARFLSFI